MHRTSSFRLVISAFALIALLAAAPAYAVDSDCDGVSDEIDNCIDKFNPDQTDTDGDGDGNRCDRDRDGDEIQNKDDNCPSDENVDQEDSDGDRRGDACDECPDTEPETVAGPGGCSLDQLCPCDGPEDDRGWRNHKHYVRCVAKNAKRFVRKRLIDRDEKKELIAEARESKCGRLMPGEGDNDGDGVRDEADNCPSDSNPSQRDTDDDGIGNACDTDKDGDGVLNRDDSCRLVPNADDQDADEDGDGVGDACDRCPGTAEGHVVRANGCSIAQRCPCKARADDRPWKNHGQFVRCIVSAVHDFRMRDLIDRERGGEIIKRAANSDCGKRPDICE